MRAKVVAAKDLKTSDLRARAYVAPALKAECVKRTYEVEVTVDEMKIILDKDNNFDLPSLIKKMENIGARDVEYDGHFGPCVWFSVNSVDDKPAFRGRILDVISRYCGRSK